MSHLRCLWLLLAVPFITYTVGCSNKDKTSSQPSSSSTASESSSSDKASNDKDSDRIKIEVNRLVVVGRKALREKHFQDAKDSFEAALRLDPTDFLAQDGLDEANDGLKALQAAGDPQVRDAEFTRLMKAGREAMDKKDYATALRKFEAAYNLKKDEEALTARDDAKKMVDFKAQIDSGDALMAVGNYKEALLAFKQALVIIPGDPDATKKADRAQKKLDAIGKDKTDKDKYDTLVADGRQSLKDKHFDDAIQSFTKANNLLPQEPEATRSLKDAKDKQKQAQADYDAAMTQGTVNLQTGMYDLARAYYMQARDAYPDNADKVTAALALVQQAQINAIAYADAIRQGRQFLKNKMYEAAVAQFDAALLLAPLDPTATTLRREAADKFKDAKGAYDKAIVAGNRALDLKNYTEALKDFDDALQLSPDDQVARAGKRKAEDGLHQQKYDVAIKAGDTAMTAKNYKEAAREYEIALEEKPGDFNATAKLKQAKSMIK